MIYRFCFLFVLISVEIRVWIVLSFFSPQLSILAAIGRIRVFDLVYRLFV